MYYRKFLFVLVALTFLFSCKNETVDCSLVLCAAGDAIRLELIENGENVITNGTYTESNITVSGEVMENLQIRVLPNTQGATSGLLEINNFDWQPGQYTYTIQLGNNWIFDVEASFTLTGNDPCCGDRLTLTALSADNFAVERGTYSSFYTIILQ